MSETRKLNWDKEAKEYFKKAIQYIKLGSPKNATIVKHTINAAVKELPDHPERYPPDKYKMGNDDLAYRAFTISNFRITYFVGELEIRIVRLRHARQDAIYY